ncbi:hypothetical protein MRB53_026200 [Persea americana]|uniref:Uncharacterized protein n=1 Tax=Persea americana TaxID=3435 RepID=A0ACC2LIK6_PERAE|nr:hypothetical protein MRB53_026200 [Persea americana]
MWKRENGESGRKSVREERDVQVCGAEKENDGAQRGRDGAWRRWVVRDEEEMMMGCCVREMGRKGEMESAGRKMELGGDGL